MIFCVLIWGVNVKLEEERGLGVGCGVLDFDCFGGVSHGKGPQYKGIWARLVVPTVRERTVLFPFWSGLLFVDTRSSPRPIYSLLFVVCVLTQSIYSLLFYVECEVNEPTNVRLSLHSISLAFVCALPFFCLFLCSLCGP